MTDLLFSTEPPPTYVVAGGNHVQVLLDRHDTAAVLDVIEITAQPGGGPPPHRHAFAEWFRVLDGELTICTEQGGEIVPERVLAAGDRLWIAPWVVHSTVNATAGVTRFEVISQPGVMSGYLADVGIRVADAYSVPDEIPPGPSELRAAAARWGIEFWSAG